MRRSLAPSQSSNAKRGKYVPIFSKSLTTTKNDATNASVTETSSDVRRSALDVLKLIGNIDLELEKENKHEEDENSTSLITAEDKSFVDFETKSKQLNENEDNPPEKYFKVVWCKRSTRKHKKWEGDAILIVNKRSVTLKDMNGKLITNAMGYKQKHLEDLEVGSLLAVGSKEIEIMEIISAEDFGSGVCFCFESSEDVQSLKPLNNNFNVKKRFQAPIKTFGLKMNSGQQKLVKPMYDITQPDAFVLTRPSIVQQFQNAETSQTVVDVVVDPKLANKLRPHQKEGILFLYECLTQIREYGGQGAILADEMGLGKTLQCITLIWTMLHQGPYDGKPLINRILIITPSSLMKNWLKEFNIWLGRERIKIYFANQSDKFEAYLKSRSTVMLTSYELAMRHHETLEKIKFDIMICDEGHRLKNTNTKTSSLLGRLPITKRILLTGTPIQNDLQEFYSLVEFCNPGILGSMICFKKVYEEPIIRSKQPSASEEEICLGEMRSAELSRLTSQFILRRTQDVNNKYLPAKTEYVIFCKPSQLQMDLYQKLLSSNHIKQCLSGTLKETGFHLICISCLKKISNHPVLIFQTAKEIMELPQQLANESPYLGLANLFPEDFSNSVCPRKEFSGKLAVASTLLYNIKLLKPKERVVLISNSTKTLDVMEKLCKIENHLFLRLDGNTPLNNRQDLVERFNAPNSDTFVFLLSSKAGGVGLNLIGSSRLILFDIDWNPANDLQAMSRVWRDGQKKHVHIYRLLTTGTIEEKIYQRQITKHSLTTVLAKASHKKMQFSIDDLKDLFSFNPNTLCSTHDLMGCGCTSRNPLPYTNTSESANSRPAQLTVEYTWNKSKNMTIDELMSWKHIRGMDIDEKLKESCLESAKNIITFLFRNSSGEEME